MFEMKGAVLCSYLQDNLFPSLGVPSRAALEYVRALQQLDLKQFKKFFVVVLQIRNRYPNIVDFCKQVISPAFQDA